MRSYNSFTAVAALRTGLGAKEDEENVFVTKLEFGDNHREVVFRFDNQGQSITRVLITRRGYVRNCDR